MTHEHEWFTPRMALPDDGSLCLIVHRRVGGHSLAVARFESTYPQGDNRRPRVPRSEPLFFGSPSCWRLPEIEVWAYAPPHPFLRP